MIKGKNMIRKSLWILFFLCFGAVLYEGIASAEIKTDYGADFRLRQDYLEKIMDLRTTGKPDMDFFRLRSSLWGKVGLNEDLGVYLKLTNEAKYYLGSYKPFETSDSTSDSNRFDVDELVVDNLYVDARNIFGSPIDIRIGRQNFLGAYGEGFLILDGTPGDGSRTCYFNAAKATWRINKSHSVDLIYLSDPKSDQYLPSLYPAQSKSLSAYVDNKRLLNASNEQGVVVYGKSKVNDNLFLEPYYIYKEEDPVGANPKLKLNTLGARAVVTVGEWKVRGEFAHQFGEYENSRDRQGNGGYIFFGRKHEKVALKPEWELGYVYLSGDDPATSQHEGWDPLFSRAPMWNELYAYILLPETAKDSGPIPGYWTNLHIYIAGVKLALASATNLAVSYQYLRSDQNTSGLTAAMFSNNSKERGQLATLILNHSFTKQIDGLLQVEYFIPGKFYNDKAENAALYRWQLQYKF
jgi:hypothetical protein